MSNEIELKLAVSLEIAENLPALLSDLHILKQETAFLGNTYYDSEDRYFAQRKMGLRVRSKNQQFEMTLKTNGEITGGLHVRPEYNFPLKDENPDVALLQNLPEFDFPKDLNLQPIFSTNFERQSWLIECGQDSEIEIALDRGQIEANRQLLPICEIEFELKAGKVQDLLTLVANLGFANGLRLSGLSKAQRGYQLARGHLPSLKDWLEKWRDFLKKEQELRLQSAVNSRQILTALLAHEQELIEETMLFGGAFFAQDFLKTVERVGSFFNLYHYYLDSKPLLQGALEQQIEQGANLDESLLEELAESHEYFYRQIQDIIRLHSETKDNVLAMRKLVELLEQGQYVKRMINLMKLTVN